MTTSTMIKNPALDGLKQRSSETKNGSNGKRRHASIVEKGGWAQMKENNDKRVKI